MTEGSDGYAFGGFIMGVFGILISLITLGTAVCQDDRIERRIDDQERRFCDLAPDPVKCLSDLLESRR